MIDNNPHFQLNCLLRIKVSLKYKDYFHIFQETNIIPRKCEFTIVQDRHSINRFGRFSRTPSRDSEQAYFQYKPNASIRGANKKYMLISMFNKCTKRRAHAVRMFLHIKKGLVSGHRQNIIAINLVEITKI